MKKKYLNPEDLFYTFAYGVVVIILYSFVTVLFITIAEPYERTLGIIIGAYSLPVLSTLIFVIFFLKWRGYYCTDGDKIILVKGRKRQEILAKDIKYIEIRHFFTKHATSGNRFNEWKYTIKLRNKKNVNFLITNAHVLRWAKEFNVRMVHPETGAQILFKLEELLNKKKKETEA